MPLDFSSNSMYFIDYQSLLIDISRSFPQVFSDLILQEEYILNWIEALQICDKYICNNSDFYYSICDKQNEMFEQEITFSKSTLKIYFSIDNAIRFCQIRKMESKTFYCRQLLEENWLQWTPVGSLNCINILRNPIIACRFPLGNKKYLLIDGNKRLSYAISHNIYSIEMFLLIEKNVLESGILPTPFEKCYYSMIIDLATLLKEKQNHKTISDKKLLSFSKLPKTKNISSFL